MGDALPIAETHSRPHAAITAGPPSSRKEPHRVHAMSTTEEFAEICRWLGQCSAIDRSHHLLPDTIQHLSVMDIRPTHGPAVMVLVRAKAENRLTFKAEAFDAARKLAKYKRQPLLIAWKQFSLWMLVDANSFTGTGSHYGISCTAAAANNLMGVVAGDYAFILRSGAGFDVSPLSAVGMIDTANRAGSIGTRPYRRSLDGFSPLHRQMLSFVPLRRVTTTRTEVVRYEACGGCGFAHQFVVDWINGGHPSPRRPHSKLLQGAQVKGLALPTLEEVLAALRDAQREDLVDVIYRQRPMDLPTCMTAC